MPRLVLRLAAGEYALCRLPPQEPAPAWAGSSPFCSVTRTPEELSIICGAEVVPPRVRADRGWRLIQLVGPFDPGVVGILASVVEPLARAEISCVAAGTFDTDYLLVKADRLDAARCVLAACGHELKD
jgi:hypothetical protein